MQKQNLNFENSEISAALGNRSPTPDNHAATKTAKDPDLAISSTALFATGPDGDSPDFPKDLDRSDRSSK